MINIGNLPQKLITFLKEVYIELKRVTWPTRSQTIKYTLIVIGFSLAMALFLGGLDLLFKTLLQKFVL